MARGVAEQGSVPWSTIVLDEMLVDCGTLEAEISALLRVREPEIFAARLLALARAAPVLHGPRLVQLIRERLPPHARSSRAACRCVRRRLHALAAQECDRAGYGRAAAKHLLRGALLQPGTLFRRRAIGILSRSLRRNTARNRLLCKEAASVLRMLAEHRVRACVFGSLAISLHARRFIKCHGDVDLVFASKAETVRAAELLVEARRYRAVRRHEWIGLTGERCLQIALRGPTGIAIELSYLPENPPARKETRVLEGVSVPVVELRALRNIYTLFLLKKAQTSSDVEKQSKKNAVLTIDRLLASRVARGTHGGDK